MPTDIAGGGTHRIAPSPHHRVPRALAWSLAGLVSAGLWAIIIEAARVL